MQENNIPVSEADHSVITQLPSNSVIQTEQQPKQSNFLVILLSSLLFISVVIAGFFAFQTQKLVKELTLLRAEPTPMAIVEPTTEPVATNSSMTTDPTANRKTYADEKYKFSLKYPDKIENHKISINVMKVTGFGYCYLYGTSKTIVVSGINARTADGVGTGDTELCDQPREIMSKKGNTFVLIPIDGNSGDLPADQIFINYDYPLSDLNIVKKNLDEILSTFKFTN